MKRLILAVSLLAVVIFGNIYFFTQKAFSSPETPIKTDLVRYTGPIRHIFFHSLVIYPEKAAADIKNATGYADNMITVAQFKNILQEIYDNGFILINSADLYSFNSEAKLKRSPLYLPKGKKPLIISLDDLNYYSYMKNGGFASRLVLENSIIKTEVIDPTGEKIITDDGDVVPILEKFIGEHPDFSFNGA